MKTTLVTITKCNAPYTTYEYRARTSDRDEAIARAIRSKWGSGAYWVADSGLRGYGQIGESVPQRLGGGTNIITGRMSLSVE